MSNITSQIPKKDICFILQIKKSNHKLSDKQKAKFSMNDMNPIWNKKEN